VVESSSRTLVCSVLFLDIVEYSKKPVAEQLQLKQAFNRILATALHQVPPRDRIILDTGDGAAVTFMGDPEDALFAALTVRNMVSDVPVRLGVNLGPVRLVKDLNGQLNIIGDGINVAQRVMSFSQPGQLLVSRSFYEVVSCLSRDYQKLFHHEGSRTDKHVREHDVYSVVGGAPMTRRLAHSESELKRRAGGWLSATGPLGLRRSALLAAPLAFFVVVGSGMAARSMMEVQRPVAAHAAPKALPAKPVTEKVAVGKPEKPGPEPAAAAAPSTSAPATGKVELAVLPWGEILVNGRSRGVSPPLRVLEIPAGPHTIEIRNSTFPSHVAKVEVKPGEAVRIQHRFR
jgi:class 3 adenylate cyclase